MQTIANSSPLWKKPPRLEIYRSTAATPSYSLATLALVKNGGKIHSTPIRYTEKALNKIAKKMPRGIGAAERAYIYVEKAVGVWKVYAVYLDGDVGHFLWRQIDPPGFIPKSLTY